MLQSKKKKTFLDKNARLAPIDETQLKTKVKGIESEQNDQKP